MLSPKQLLALEASNESRNVPLRLPSVKDYPLPPDDKIVTFDGFKAPLLQEDNPVSVNVERQRDALDNQVFISICIPIIRILSQRFTKIAGKQGCIYRQQEAQVLKLFPGISPLYKVQG
jgi:hypothetical protein